MILLSSYIILIGFLYLLITNNINIIGAFLFFSFAVPSQINYTEFLGLNFSKVLWIIFSIYVIRKNKQTNHHPLPIYLFILFFIILLTPSFLSDARLKPAYQMLVYTIPDFFIPGMLLFYSINSIESVRVVLKWTCYLIIFWSGFAVYESITASNFFIDQLAKELPNNNYIVFGYNYIEGLNERFGSTVRAQATVYHPISFGGRVNLLLSLVLMFDLIFNSSISKKLKNFIFFTILIAIIASFLSLSRSCWAYTFFLILFYTRYSNILKKSILINVIYGFAFLLLVFNFNKLYDSFSSIDGSSLNMRSTQFANIIDLIGDQIYFGLGQDADAIFVEKFGYNSNLFGFESFFFHVFFNSGIAGLLYYTIFFSLIMSNSVLRRALVFKQAILLIVIPYLAFILLTGEMLTFWLFWLIVNVAYAFVIIKNQIDKSSGIFFY